MKRKALLHPLELALILSVPVGGGLGLYAGYLFELYMRVG